MADVDIVATMNVPCPECRAVPGEGCRGIDIDGGSFCHSARVVRHQPKHVGDIPRDIGYGRGICAKCGQVVPRYVMGGLCQHRDPAGEICNQESGRVCTADDLWALLDAQQARLVALRERVQEAIR